MPVAFAALATSSLKIQALDRCHNNFNAASFARRFLFLSSLRLLITHPLWDLVRMFLPAIRLNMSFLVTMVACYILSALLLIRRLVPTTAISFSEFFFFPFEFETPTNR